jgi:hypothetical protein
MSENLPFACSHLSEQSDMFFEHILPGFAGGVKALQPDVVNHLFGGHSIPP